MTSILKSRRLLTFLSYLSGAPIVAAPVFVVLGLLEAASVIIIGVCLIFASLVPVLGILYFARSAGQEYDIPDRRARIRPFIVAIASYVIGFLLLVSMKAPLLVSGLMLAYSINTSAMYAVTMFWKISIHAAGITGPLTFLVFRLGYPWALLYLFVVPVGMIRLRLKQHTVLQVVAGAMLSAVLTWAEIIYLVPLVSVQVG